MKLHQVFKWVLNVFLEKRDRFFPPIPSEAFHFFVLEMKLLFKVGMITFFGTHISSWIFYKGIEKSEQWGN